MPSLRKTDANRRNGKLGGPTALNATKHRLTSKTLVTNAESNPAFKELTQSFGDRFQPADAVELDLVQEMVACRWRLRRIWRAETGMINRSMDRHDHTNAILKQQVSDEDLFADSMHSLTNSAGPSSTLWVLRDLRAPRKSQEIEPHPPKPPRAPVIISKNDKTNPPQPLRSSAETPIGARRPQPTAKSAPKEVPTPPLT